MDVALHQFLLDELVTSGELPTVENLPSHSSFNRVNVWSSQQENSKNVYEDSVEKSNHFPNCEATSQDNSQNLVTISESHLSKKEVVSKAISGIPGMSRQHESKDYENKSENDDQDSQVNPDVSPFSLLDIDELEKYGECPPNQRMRFKVIRVTNEYPDTISSEWIPIRFADNNNHVTK